MRFAFIQATRQEQPGWSVALLCRALEVSRSGYLAWQHRQRQPSAHQQEKAQAEARLVLHIKAAHRRGRAYSGSPRVHQALRDNGIRVSRKRVARLMRLHGLRGRSRVKQPRGTTDSRHAHPVAPNRLARCFAPAQIGRVNRFWCGDITYVPTEEGWLYLATVQDVFSRRILGWSLSESLESSLVESAWRRARHMRGFEEGEEGRGPELFHSDRGSQYASRDFQQHLEQADTLCSMSAKGECLDNAVAESFFGTYKAELLADQPQRRFTSKAEAYTLTADYIDNFYNLVRLHSTLGYKSPVAFELVHHLKEPTIP